MADGPFARVQDEALRQDLAAAVHLVRHYSGAFSPSVEQKLQFYGLYKQVTLGDCSDAQPGFFEGMAAKYKWSAWRERAGMTADEAAAAYVAGLSDGWPEWRQWSGFTGAPPSVCPTPRPPSLGTPPADAAGSPSSTPVATPPPPQPPSRGVPSTPPATAPARASTALTAASARAGSMSAGMGRLKRQVQQNLSAVQALEEQFSRLESASKANKPSGTVVVGSPSPTLAAAPPQPQPPAPHAAVGAGATATPPPPPSKLPSEDPMPPSATRHGAAAVTVSSLLASASDQAARVAATTAATTAAQTMASGGLPTSMNQLMAALSAVWRRVVAIVRSLIAPLLHLGKRAQLHTLLPKALAPLNAFVGMLGKLLANALRGVGAEAPAAAVTAGAARVQAVLGGPLPASGSSVVILLLLLVAAAVGLRQHLEGFLLSALVGPGNASA